MHICICILSKKMYVIEKFEDTKYIIRRRKSNGQKKKDKK